MWFLVKKKEKKWKKTKPTTISTMYSSTSIGIYSSNATHDYVFGNSKLSYVLLHDTVGFKSN